MTVPINNEEREVLQVEILKTSWRVCGLRLPNDIAEAMTSVFTELLAARRPPVSVDNAGLIAEANAVRDGHQAFAVIPKLVAALSASQPREAEVTDDMVNRAAVAMYFEDCGNTPDARERATEDFDAHFREMARVALLAALGGGDHAE